MEIRGSAGLIACTTCGQTSFEIPRNETGDPLITCTCGHLLGPIFSLRAFANDETHTLVNAKLVRDNDPRAEAQARKAADLGEDLRKLKQGGKS
jgi:hypothetical protein